MGNQKIKVTPEIKDIVIEIYNNNKNWTYSKITAELYKTAKTDEEREARDIAPATVAVIIQEYCNQIGEKREKIAKGAKPKKKHYTKQEIKQGLLSQTLQGRNKERILSIARKNGIEISDQDIKEVLLNELSRTKDQNKILQIAEKSGIQISGDEIVFWISKNSEELER